MDDRFREDERLFRAVLPAEAFWKPDGRVSSAAFKTKEPDGLSTDRDGGRAVQDCINAISESLKGRIVSVTYSDCADVSAEVVYAPVEAPPNPYHSLIRNSVEKAQLTRGQCRHLAEMCEIHT